MELLLLSLLVQVELLLVVPSRLLVAQLADTSRLVGLPVVLNRRRGRQIPELHEPLAVMVENTPEGYREALNRLIQDAPYRERIGQTAATHAWNQWDPEKMERRLVEVYQRVIAQASQNSWDH